MNEKIGEILKGIEVPVIVEGKRDEVALRRFGIKIIIRMSGRSLYDLALYVSERHEEVVILTDFDRAGSEIAGKLNLLFGSLRIKVDTRTRGRLKKEAVKYGISQIESLRP